MQICVSEVVCGLAISELISGSNTPPTDSTDLRVTMQHKFGTALIWHDRRHGLCNVSLSHDILMLSSGCKQVMTSPGLDSLLKCDA